MTNFGKIILLVIVVVALGVVVFFLQKKPVEDLSNYTVNVSPVVAPSITETQTTNMYNQGDLISFSITSGSKVSGIQNVTGVLKGGYFFEANVILRILDANKNVLKNGNGTATADWTTVNPIPFKATLDFTGLPAGPAFIEIHNDNASGLPQYDKSILIPIVLQ